ncbi:hypothetical protein LCGC14_0148540 [marine sediment metagenome]|uniref:DUF4337 domain-containing protein n=1 Tax=marine sediment metagenome TaxID=412755 RepID=A0A0F9UZF9_9ZZZZ|nr:DUF4337 domain-containing protein [Maribacter sp.]HDZ06328.1 DUF4337 domain-containing protein [Maribacter sp.]HEA81911.1 DUF4337 domain-containing protein [Maribacter sp.]
MLQEKNKGETVVVSVASERAEAIGGVLIAIFAALMAISQMVNGELEEEMMIAHNNVVSYSNWYQSKSIKESLKEGELDYLKALIESGIVTEGKKSIIEQKIAEVGEKIIKYESEKTEILLGSDHVGKENWVQDIEGEMGIITGVKEWERLTKSYDYATKRFDYALLFFQICIVLGAVCIIIYDNPRLQKGLIVLMIIFGITGASLSIYGYLLAP